MEFITALILLAVGILIGVFVAPVKNFVVNKLDKDGNGRPDVVDRFNER